MRIRFWSSFTECMLLAALASSCAAQPKREPLSSDAASTKDSAAAPANAADSQHRESKRFGYSWTLPEGWAFVDPGPFWKLPPVPAVEVHGAQHSPDGPFLLAITTDVMHIVPGMHAGDDPKDYDSLEASGAEFLRQENAEFVGSRRLRMFELETVEVTGDQGLLRISIRMLYRGYRKFEFRCFDLGPQADWRCASALSAFRIEDLPEPPR